MNLRSHFLRKTYWIKDYIQGSPIRAHYNDIRTIMENPFKGLEIKQTYLSNLLDFITTNSKFYNKYKSAHLKEYPIVNKSILTENYGHLKIDPNKIPYQIGEIKTQSTSGSTGTPFTIPQDTRKRNRRLAELKYFGEIVGFKSHDKLIHLRAWNRWQNKSRIQSLRENIIPFDISQLNSSRLDTLCQSIAKYNVVALRGYASSIDLLAHHIAENNITLPSLKLIIAGSESLQDSTRELVKQYIGCNIISQYANEENGILAQEAASNEISTAFYLNQASYFFEIIKLNSDEPAKYGELGRIVLTDLFNYAFPIIRYDTGDTGVMLKKTERHSEYPVLGKLYGRKVDLIFDINGNVVHPTGISRLLKNYNHINQWQFIQLGKKNYSLILSTQYRDLQVTEIQNELVNLLGKNAEITIKFLNEIPVLASGKRKPIINNWKR